MDKREKREFVSDNYQRMSALEMAAAIGCALSSIYYTMCVLNLGFKKRTKKPRKYDEYVLENYETKTPAEMATALSCNIKTVKNICKRYQIGGYSPDKRTYTISENEYYILKNFREQSIEDMAEILGVNRSVIYKVLYKNKLSAHLCKRELNPKEKYILRNCHEQTISEIAKNLNCTIHNIYNVAKRLSVKCTKKTKAQIEEDEKEIEEWMKIMAEHPDRVEDLVFAVYGKTDFGRELLLRHIGMEEFLSKLPRDNAGKIIRHQAEYNQGSSYLTLMEKYSQIDK